MPVWHEATRKWVKDGKLALLGITQEQHAGRCRLFAQWKDFDWPILHDPINVMQSMAVPIIIAIDEHGIVRSTRPNPRTFEAEFLDKTFPAPDKATEKSSKPNIPELKNRAKQNKNPSAWRDYGDALALWEPDKVDEAISAYQKAIELAPEDGNAHFRLGVCYRMRYDSPARQPGDFQAAINHWTDALELDPNQYIWRRRIQQYGPRLIKPYPFYDWVEQARKEIRSRGEKPIRLPVEPSGAEIAEPSREFITEKVQGTNPDPKGKIARDKEGLVRAEATLVPPRIKPGETVRLHITLQPSEEHKTHWSNDVGTTQIWIDAPEGWQIEKPLHIIGNDEPPESTEPRRIEVELRSPQSMTKTVPIQAYALYYVCEDRGGTCQYLRQDISADVGVDGK